MTRPFIEKFKVWRLAKIRERKFSRGGRGLALDVAILHRIFAVAVECEMVLGDTVATVEKHYAPFVKELHDRTRRIMGSGEGLEKTNCTDFARSAEPKGRIQ